MLLLNLYMPSAPGFQCQKHLHTKCSTSGVPWTYFWFNLRFLLNFPWVFFDENSFALLLKLLLPNPFLWNYFRCGLRHSAKVHGTTSPSSPSLHASSLTSTKMKSWRRRRLKHWKMLSSSKKFLQLNRRENTIAKILIAQKLQNLRFLTKKICHTMMHLSKSDTSFCSLMTTYWPMIDRLAIFDEKIIKKYSLPNPTIQIWDWKLLKTFL